MTEGTSGKQPAEGETAEPDAPEDRDVEAQEGLAARLEEAEREIEQFKRLAQRGQADLVNYRNRVRIEQDELQGRVTRRVGSRFLDIVDQFEHALAGEASNGVDRQWVDGVQAIYQKFLAALSTEGFERFDVEGEQFDPRRHDALLATPTSDHAPNTVIRQITAGYTHRGDVVRPAQVEIAAEPQDQQE